MRRAILLTAVSLLFLSISAEAQEDAERDAAGEGLSVLMIIAHKDFRDEEYQVPRSVFEQKGMEVTVVSSDTSLARGMLGLEVKPDILLEDTKVEECDCLIFVGGAGSREYWGDEVAHSLAKTAADSGKVVGAICIAPATLARAGVLKGQKATVFPMGATKSVFKEEGVVYTGEDVTVSGRIVTARGPEAALKFANEIVRLLMEESRPSKEEE